MNSQDSNPVSEWERVNDLFHAALERPGDERAAWLAEQTASPAVREEVRSLLASLSRQDEIPVEADAPSPAPPLPLPAENFGAYRPVRLIGQGGMGAVYLAERADGRFERNVAVKIVAAHLAGADFLRRFETEGRLLAGLDHPNITSLIDGGVSLSGQPYLVLEYVEGERIDTYCDARKLGIRDRLRLFQQVCEAVDYAHRNLILHCDLKPGNILVTEAGTVKLLDFGTASLMAEDASVTVTRARMLTPRYASPEQLRGERLTTASDVFSLGMILYELLTGAMPFPTGTSLISFVERAMQDTEPTDPSTALTEEAASARATSVGQLRQALRGDLSSIVLKALSNDRARRYESALAFTADIRNYLDGRPVLARPQTAWYRARKFLRRRWLPAAAAAIFVLGLLGATLFAIRQAKVARDEAQNAAAQARKAEKVSEFLNDMLSSASKLAFEPRKFTVAQMLDAAQPQLEKSWKDDPLVEATLRDSLASSYIAVQGFDKAKVQLDKALATFRSLGNRLEEAKTLLLLGYFYDATGQIEESVRYYRGALEKFDRLGKAAPNLQVFRLKRNLAYDLYAFLNRDLGDAHRLIADALDIAARDPLIPGFDVVQAQSVQAAMLGDEGRTAEAETILLRALEIGRHEENGRGANVPLTGLIVLNARKRNYAAARDYAAEQYRLILRDLGPDHVDTAAAEIGWARHRAETGELREAVQQVRNAMVVLRKAYPPLSAHLWAPMTGAASVLNRAGRYKEAEGYARELIAQCNAEHLTEADARVAESLLRLGDALLGERRYREAFEILERSARDYEQAGPIWAKRAEAVRSKIKEKRAEVN